MLSPQKCFWAAIGALLVLTSAASYADGDSPSLEERCRREVVELHQFLEDWSNAALPPTEEAYLRFGEVIAPSFLLIDPDGFSVASQEVLEAIRNAHGRWTDAPGAIRIENFRFHHAGGALALATYEEWHDLGEASNGRISTVLFGANDETPNGLEWLHLHEAWLERAGD